LVLADPRRGRGFSDCHEKPPLERACQKVLMAGGRRQMIVATPGEEKREKGERRWPDQRGTPALTFTGGKRKRNLHRAVWGWCFERKGKIFGFAEGGKRDRAFCGGFSIFRHCAGKQRAVLAGREKTDWIGEDWAYSIAEEKESKAEKRKAALLEKEKGRIPYAELERKKKTGMEMTASNFIRRERGGGLCDGLTH